VVSQFSRTRSAQLLTARDNRTIGNNRFIVCILLIGHFSCVIEGVNVSATPAGAMFTYYVSGADLNAYLILDNATFGRLDFNKLGY